MAQDKEREEEKVKIKELEAKLASMERKAKLAELAPKYANFFPKNMREAKLNEILNSKQPLAIVQAKIQEASDIFTNKTVVKVASMPDSIYELNSDGSDEISIAGRI